MRGAAICLVLFAACGDDNPSDTVDAAAGDAKAPVDVSIPTNTWTWIEIPGNVCANGSPTGIGINLPPTPSDDLFVYFEGGGACWDENSCFTLKTAINIENDYDAAQFATDIGTTMADRSAGNAFGRATLVWVPYCTGDLHAGIATRTYGAHTVHHAGATNAQNIVDFLHDLQPSATHVWVGGSSAGGYGATFDHHRFAAAWPSIDVHLMQDGAPYVPPLAGYSIWRDAWDMQYPPNCTGCTTEFPKIVDAVQANHPNSRLALMHYNDDAIIKQYFGYAATAGSMVTASNALVDHAYEKPNAHAFMLAGSNHTMFGGVATLVAPGGVKLSDWLTQWANGDAAWTTIRP